METQRRTYSRRQLIFLTPEGREPTTIDPRLCVCLSYQEDIRRWLREVHRSIAAPHVRDVLEQYSEVIEALGGHPMVQRTRSKLIDLLTSQDNLPSVLKILRHHDEIHTLVLTRFWTDLDKHLASKVRRVIQGGAQLHWVADWREDPMTRWTGTRLYLSGSQDQPQALNFCIEQTLEPQVYQLDLGLNWTDEVKPRSPVLRVPEVQRVADEERRREFEVPDPPTYWHGRKMLEKYSGLAEFLAEYVEQPGPMVRKLSEAFWRHVKDTYPLVVRANRAVAAQRR
jgi:hypothetical protein